MDKNDSRRRFVDIDSFDPLITAAWRSLDHTRCIHSIVFEPDVYKTTAKLISFDIFLFQKSSKMICNIFSEMFNIFLMVVKRKIAKIVFLAFLGILRILDLWIICFFHCLGSHARGHFALLNLDERWPGPSPWSPWLDALYAHALLLPLVFFCCQ